MKHKRNIIHLYKNIMRIWSIHPQYLDSKGLVALWRETLLAKHVLEGKTKGYKNHPQLKRFKDLSNPVNAIHQYLGKVYDEAILREYNFDENKFIALRQKIVLTVTEGQIEYEWRHLLGKLKIRDEKLYKQLKKINNCDVHPIFRVVKGPVEDWEIL
ncbi:MAG: hypothetical protein JWN78_890 [Bacteroidota bacterium]|nr:hypothetical protein [Bacteroidota bacterium]